MPEIIEPDHACEEVEPSSQRPTVLELKSLRPERRVLAAKVKVNVPMLYDRRKAPVRAHDVEDSAQRPSNTGMDIERESIVKLIPLEVYLRVEV